MKIAIILPCLGGGGAERLHVSLANYWATLGHKVEFILMQKKGELVPLVLPEVSIYDLKADRIRNILFPLVSRLKKIEVDITLTAMWPLTSISTIAWYLSGKSGGLFLSEHNHLSVSTGKGTALHAFFLKATIRVTYSLATGIIAVSKGVKNDLCDIGNISKDRIRVIYNPAATGIICQDITKKKKNELWVCKRDYNILSVGSLSDQKDHKVLIKSFALVSKEINANLVILGKGPLKRALMELIAQLNLQNKVHMPGFCLDPSPWFCSADLFVSTSKWEGFGNVIVESLECGTPVVSTDCLSGPSEILDNGRFGRLVPVGDEVLIAEAIVESCKEMHDKNKLMDRAKEFSVQKISTEYLDYFSKENVE